MLSSGAPPPGRRRAARPRRRRSRGQRRAGPRLPTSRPRRAGCDLVAFPELAVTGYPPEDLLLRPAFVEQAREALEKVAARTGPRCGDRRASPSSTATSTTRRRCARDGTVLGHLPQAPLAQLRGVRRGALLRAVAHGRSAVPSIGGVRVAVTVCEDAWSPSGPMLTQAAAGAELVVNVNASPYYAGRLHEREAMLADAGRRRVGVPILYVNLVGGQDELVFDGCVDAVRRDAARLVARAQQFDEDLLVVDVDVHPASRRRALDPRGASARTRFPRSPSAMCTSSTRAVTPRVEPPLAPVHEVYEALVLGTRDYVTQERLLRRADRAVGRRSTRRSSPRSPSTRSVPTTSSACSCRRGTRATTASPTRTCSPTTSASAPSPCRSSPRTTPSSTCSPSRSRGSSPGSPRRTSRPASAARSS